MYGNATWSSVDGPHVAYVNDPAAIGIKPKECIWVKVLEKDSLC